MKLKTFTLSILFICSMNMMATPADTTTVKPIDMGAKRTVKTIEGPLRSPIRTPEVYIDGNTLIFDASCIGCTIFTNFAHKVPIFNS